MRSYSQIFSCIHDETQPVGQIGRGTHYSVFRVPEWRDVKGRPLTKAEIHDFAVIWDEDHDDRVIAIAERLYINGLFSPVQFIGERKGGLTIITASIFRTHLGEVQWQNWCDQVTGICSTVGWDSWTVEFGEFDKSLGSPAQTYTSGLIADREDKVVIYLRNIDSLWNLGTWPYQDRIPVPQPNPPISAVPPMPVMGFPRPPMQQPPAPLITPAGGNSRPHR